MKKNEKSKAREAAMKLLFASLFGADTVPESDDEEAVAELSSRDRVFAQTLYDGVNENNDKLSDVIKEFSTGWSIERIGKVELCILKMAIYEILYLPEVPLGATINEAVELAKCYCDDKSPAFINGILGSVGRKYRD